MEENETKPVSDNKIPKLMVENNIKTWNEKHIYPAKDMAHILLLSMSTLNFLGLLRVLKKLRRCFVNVLAKKIIKYGNL